MQKWLLYIMTLFYYPTAFALFCPTNFNSIEIGNSIDHVLKQCGKPHQEMTHEVAPPSPQQWDYYIEQKPGFATVRMSVAFQKGKVINISVNGAGISNTKTCGGQPVKVGDTIEVVEKACGKPSFVTESAIATESNKKKQIIEWQYQSTPKTTLIFEDGKLKERK